MVLSQEPSSVGSLLWRLVFVQCATNSVRHDFHEKLIRTRQQTDGKVVC